MNNDLMNKISLPLQRLNNRYSFMQKGIKGFYNQWDKNGTIVSGQNLDLFQQFENIQYRFFLKDAGIPEFSEDYVNANVVLIDDNTISIHQETARILFYYLVNELKNSIIHFLKLIDGEAFASRFVGSYNAQNNKVHIHPQIADKVLAFFDANIADFKLVFHLFRENDTVAISNDYNGNLVFNIKAIQNYLDNNEKYYDYTNFKIA